MKKLIILICCIFVITGCGKEKIINITIEKYCENGEPENGQCKIISSIPAETTCPDGYPLNENSKYCENVISIDSEWFLTCEEGFDHLNGKCISQESYPKNEDGKCDSNYTLLNGECKEIRYHFYGYICPYGTLNQTTHKCDIADQKTPVVTCPEGYIANQEKLTCETISYELPKEREVKTEEQ